MAFHIFAFIQAALLKRSVSWCIQGQSDIRDFNDYFCDMSIKSIRYWWGQHSDMFSFIICECQYAAECNTKARCESLRFTHKIKEMTEIGLNAIGVFFFYLKFHLLCNGTILKSSLGGRWCEFVQSFTVHCIPEAENLKLICKSKKIHS